MVFSIFTLILNINCFEQELLSQRINILEKRFIYITDFQHFMKIILYFRKIEINLFNR
jgi:hypothetical protein